MSFSQLSRRLTTPGPIALGAGDTFSRVTYKGNCRKIIKHALKNSEVPVLITKAGALESQQGAASPEFVHNIVRWVGAQFCVPVIDEGRDTWPPLLPLPFKALRTTATGFWRCRCACRRGRLEEPTHSDGRIKARNVAICIGM
jgi:hypothetical protein